MSSESSAARPEEVALETPQPDFREATPSAVQAPDDDGLAPPEVAQTPDTPPLPGALPAEDTMAPGPLVLLLMAVSITVVLTGRLDAWAGFLCPDVDTYIHRAADFFEHQTTAGGEYQPGALFFFGLVRLTTQFAFSFCDALEAINCLLLALTLLLIYQLAGRRSLLAACVMFMAMGPISMYRFELFVSLFVLLAWWAWDRNSPILAGVLLGIAVTIKVYPIALVPVFMVGGPRLWRQGGRVAAGCALGVAAVLLAFALKGGKLAEIPHTLDFHRHKPVALDSVPGAAMQALQALGFIPPQKPYDEYGIHGFRVEGRLHSAPTLLTAFCIAVACGMALWTRPATARQSLAYVVSILASTLVLSSLLVPQYVLWIAALVALLPVTGMRLRPWWTLVALLAIFGITQQYVYPLHYDDYLSLAEKHEGGWPLLFLCIYLSKLCLVAFFVVLHVELWHMVKTGDVGSNGVQALSRPPVPPAQPTGAPA